MQDICNKSIEINFFVGCMVSRPNHLFKVLTTMSLINKISPSPLPPVPQVPTALLTASATAASLVLHLDDRRGPRPPNSSHRIPFSRGASRSQLARVIGVEGITLILLSYHSILRRNNKNLALYHFARNKDENQSPKWVIHQKKIIFMSSEWWNRKAMTY